MWGGKWDQTNELEVGGWKKDMMIIAVRIIVIPSGFCFTLYRPSYAFGYLYIMDDELEI